MGLAELRKGIDAVDMKILSLLNERAELAKEIAVAKQGKEPIYAPAREAQVIRNLIAGNRGNFPDSALKAVYSEIISASRALEKPLGIAYLGPEASFTHAAAIKKFGAGAELYAKDSIGGVFRAVDEGDADLGIVPVENSAEGAVNSTLDVLQESDLQIAAEAYLNISHCLLSNSELHKIARIYSHSQAFAQCRLWLQKNLPKAELIEAGSTAKAAEISSRERNSGAIASLLASEKYALRIIAQNIEDGPRNKTRFIVIGKAVEPKKTGRDKTGIMFSVKHEAGALYRALGPLHKNSINMTLIESRPSKNRAWEYVFFIDFQGFCKDAKIEGALKEMEKRCTFLKVIGCYPEESAG